jgi:hypothetical protein
MLGCCCCCFGMGLLLFGGWLNYTLLASSSRIAFAPSIVNKTHTMRFRIVKANTRLERGSKSKIKRGGNERLQQSLGKQ